MTREYKEARRTLKIVHKAIVPRGGLEAYIYESIDGENKDYSWFACIPTSVSERGSGESVDDCKRQIDEWESDYAKRHPGYLP